MSLTKKIWSFLIGGWTCNPLDHSNCPQLQVRNFKFEKKIILIFMKIFEKNHKKRHISKTTRIWAVIFSVKIRNPLSVPLEFFNI